MKASFEDADELDGFEELNDDDKDKIRKAWDVGHVADEDIPETARKPEKDDADEDEDDEDEKPKKKKAAAKPSKKAADDSPRAFKLEYAASSRSKCKGMSINGMSRCTTESGSLRRWLRWYRVPLISRKAIFSRCHCIESIGKSYLRLGHEVDFRGNKSWYVYSLMHCLYLSRTSL